MCHISLFSHVGARKILHIKIIICFNSFSFESRDDVGVCANKNKNLLTEV